MNYPKPNRSTNKLQDTIRMQKSVSFILSVLLFLIVSTAVRAFPGNVFTDTTDVFHDLIKKGDVKTLEDMLKIRPDLIESHYGIGEFTPLQTAVSENRIETAKFLIKKGADVNGRDRLLDTPLHHAAWTDRRFEMAKLLISKGAGVNLKNKLNRRTPLHIASKMSSIRIIKLLVKNGANVNAQRKDGKTPLHLAVIKGDLKTVKVLLDLGADRNIKDNSAASPLDYSRNRNDYRISDLLEKYGNK